MHSGGVLCTHNLPSMVCRERKGAAPLQPPKQGRSTSAPQPELPPAAAPTHRAAPTRAQPHTRVSGSPITTSPMVQIASSINNAAARALLGAASPERWSRSPYTHPAAGVNQQHPPLLTGRETSSHAMGWSLRRQHRGRIGAGTAQDPTTAGIYRRH